MPRATTAPQTAPIVIQQTIPATEPEKKQRKEKPDVWTYMKSLSPQDWRHHIAYVYRVRPNVGNKQAEKYLDKFSQAFTIDDIKERFGGETFRIMLNRDGEAYITEEFSIEAAPKFDMAREIPATDAAQTALVRDLVDRLDGKTANNVIVDEAMGKSINIMSSAFEAALSKLAGAGGGNDLLKTIQVMRELGLIGQPHNGLRDAILLLKELGIVGGERPVDRVQEFRDMVSAVKELTGNLAADATPGNWKTRLVDKLSEVAPQLIQQVSGMMDKQQQIEHERTHRVEMMAGARANLAGAPSNVQPKIQAAQPPHQPVTHQTEPIRTVPLDRNSTASQPQDTSGQPSQAWISQRVYDAIAAGQSGEAVIDFLDVVNPQICEYFAKLSPDQIRSTFQQDVILKRATELANFEEWLAEAVQYLHEEPQQTQKPN